MSHVQEDDARLLYDERAVRYDDSWHPRFAGHVVELIKPRPGERVLDLACGTGLVSFLAAEAVGPSGRVVGVDISSGMLSMAKAKKEACRTKNLEFHLHSITDLDSLNAIREQQFDIITCASALPLLPHPTETIKEWACYLRPGGRLIADVPHTRSFPGLLTMERVARELGRRVPSYRLCLLTAGQLRQSLEDAGLRDVDVKLVSQWKGNDSPRDLEDYICSLDRPVVHRSYWVKDGQSIFEDIIRFPFSRDFAEESVRSAAKASFLQYWADLADADGGIDEVDGVFVAVGVKANV